jgi:hypothetical protein
MDRRPPLPRPGCPHPIPCHTEHPNRTGAHHSTSADRLNVDYRCTRYLTAYPASTGKVMPVMLRPEWPHR